MGIAHELLERHLATVAMPAFVTDTDGRILYWNTAAERLTGYRPEAMVGRRCSNAGLRHITDDGRCMCGTACPLKQIACGQGRADVQVFLRHRDGHRVPVRARSRGICDAPGHVAGVLQVFTRRPDGRLPEEMRRQLEHAAYLDPRAGVPNRAYVLKALDARHGLLADAAMGLLLVDIDGFSGINDDHGWAAADAVLKAIARSVTAAVSPVDLVARWHDDRLLVLLDSATPVRLGEVVARVKTLARWTDIPHPSQPIQPTVSVGGILVCGGEPVADALARLERVTDDAEAAGPGGVSLQAAA